MTVRHASGILVFAALAAACASSAGVGRGPTVVNDPHGVATSDAGGRQIAIAEDGSVADSVAASPDSAFQALVRAYGELGLATPLLELWSRRVGDPTMTATRAFKGSPLSRFLSSGDGITGPRANNDRVMMSIVSQVKPRSGGGGSRLETRVTAVAIDTGGRGGQAQCTTTGELEELLHAAARAALPE